MRPLEKVNELCGSCYIFYWMMLIKDNVLVSCLNNVTNGGTFAKFEKMWWVGKSRFKEDSKNFCSEHLQFGLLVGYLSGARELRIGVWPQLGGISMQMVLRADFVWDPFGESLSRERSLNSKNQALVHSNI